MLDVLESLQPDEAAQVLAATAHALSPDPEVAEVIQSKSVSPELIRKSVSQLREHLHLDADDNSPRAQAKMFALLSKAISERFLAQNLAEVRRRLGRRGDLAPNDYKIIFSEEVEDFCLKFGIRKKQVMETLQRPDQVEHLLREQVEAGDAPAVSLYMRRVGSPHTRDSHNVLVQTIRTDDQQKVIAAFLVFHREVSISPDATPLKALESFLNVYGLAFRIGPVEAEKFVLHEVRPLPVEKFDLNNLLKVEAPNKEHYLAFGFFRESALGALQVVVAYAVNADRYAADLESHAIRVMWQHNQLSPRLSIVSWK